MGLLTLEDLVHDLSEMDSILNIDQCTEGEDKDGDELTHTDFPADWEF